MKYLKKYENTKEKLHIKIVDFSDGGDGITAVYVNNKLIKSGDYEIEDWVEGFVEGLKYAKIPFDQETIYLESKHNDPYDNNVKIKDLDFIDGILRKSWKDMTVPENFEDIKIGLEARKMGLL